MVTAIEIKPAALLQPFVHCYALRTFNTGDMLMPKPLHALNECFMTFFLKDKFCYMVNETGNVKRAVSNNIYCLFTQPAGCSYYKGDFTLFAVEFKANGLFAIFGVPQRILLNTLLTVEDILGSDNCLVTEQLESSKNINEMAHYMNNYLTGKLLSRKHKFYTALIAEVSNKILKKKGPVSIDALASYVNMSLRNFERRFIDEVGMPPKLYMRITRFYTAIQNKSSHPEKNWTTISHECGYFDQAHFIRDCREFSSKSPEELFKYTPPPTESFVEKVE